MKRVFEGQVGHFLSLAVLLFIVLVVWNSDESFSTGSLLGWQSRTWFVIAISIPIAHQVYVWIVWRLELHFKTLSNLLGDKAFKVYKIDFTLLILSRLLSVLFLGIANEGTLQLSSFWCIIISVILFIPLLYLMYSIVNYFGFERAYGLDHFKSEKASQWPMVRQGIFSLTPNAMYVFGFLMLYIIALLARSEAALLVALFSHMYIWIHYFFTEKIDMTYIYIGDKSEE